MSSILRTATATVLTLAFVFPHPAFPRGRATGEEHSFEAGGSIRTVAAGIDNYEEPLLFGEGNDSDGLSVTILRLTAEGEGEDLTAWEIHLVQDLFYSTAPDGSGTTGSIGIITTETRYRVADLAWTWAESDEFRATLLLDRFNAAVSPGRADLTAGRQAINFSQAWFWNPLDIFSPFDPEAFDRSYKPGVDALRADYDTGPFSSITLVAALGRKLTLGMQGGALRVEAEDFADEAWYGSAIMARGRSNWSGWDITLQGGKVYGGWQAGAGFSGELGTIGVRGEATYLLAAGDGGAVLPAASAERGPRSVDLVDDHVKVVLGADHRFDSSLYLNAEYFYNGAGEEEDLGLALARVAVGETTNLGEHLTGLLASYEFHPLLTGQLSWVHSFSDGSDMLLPTFSWSLADEAELLLGAILGFGEEPAGGTERLELQSEFGTYPDFYFLELIYYF